MDLERCHDLARRPARMPPEAVTLNKRAVDAVADANTEGIAGVKRARSSSGRLPGWRPESTSPDRRRGRQKPPGARQHFRTMSTGRAPATTPASGTKMGQKQNRKEPTP